jgi:3-hydroxymyristoyl/3-hydroxydecanoyl-(acyl carrier protein) dehydratase
LRNPLRTEGGQAGLGRIRGEKLVRYDEWFFKAHFFQDPVQPGSLGLEALLQLLQFHMLEAELGQDIPNGRFQAVAVDHATIWKYRGQVVPRSRVITSDMEILEQGQDETGVFVIGSGSLFVDGKRIYHAPRIGMRMVPGERAVRRNLDIRPFWRKHLAITSPPMEAFYQGLIHQFIRAFEFEDARVSEKLKGRNVLYLANHQCQIESMLFLIAVSAFMESPVVALSNAKHRSRWLGDLVRHSFSYPGMKDPGLIRYFDQSRPESQARPVVRKQVGAGTRRRDAADELPRQSEHDQRPLRSNWP